MTDILFQLIQEGGWQVVELGLGVSDQQPDIAFGKRVVVNDPRTAALAHSTTGPTHLPHPPTTGYDIAGQRIRGQPGDEFLTLAIVSYGLGIALENLGFDDRVHALTIRQGRIVRQGALRMPSTQIPQTHEVGVYRADHLLHGE